VRARLDKRLGGGEAGLTLIEVLVASFVLVLGAGATFGVLGAATKNAQRAKATQVALDLAQEELERLRSIPYEDLAVNTMPVQTSNPKDPNSRISGGLFALRRSPLGAYFPVDVDAEKGVSPESDFFTGDSGNGGVRGTLYRYVVWRDDPGCSEEACEGTQDYKQVVVAVKPDRAVSQGGEAGYVEVQSALTEPALEEAEISPEQKEQEEKEAEEEAEEEEEGPGNSSDVTAQQFFLSDTACASAGETVRQEITADHLLHNTLGTCASGPQTGTTLGAPDALLLTGPPDPFPEDEALPVLHDYADDFYLEPTPDTDKGVQIRRDDTSGCHYDPAGATNPESQVHRWVTDEMPKAYEARGKVTLEFYTRTLNDALYTGTLCVFLFEREEEEKEGQPVATDTMLIDTVTGDPYWAYQPEGNGYWPRNTWAKIRLTMRFQEAPETIQPHNRLGVALSVDRANTPADAIPIMYDHPNYATRLEVDTKTPLDSGAEEEGGGEEEGG
jgi:type II secretory pathway pseudopilin PulG